MERAVKRSASQGFMRTACVAGGVKWKGQSSEVAVRVMLRTACVGREARLAGGTRHVGSADPQHEERHGRKAGSRRVEVHVTSTRCRLALTHRSLLLDL